LAIEHQVLVRDVSFTTAMLRFKDEMKILCKSLNASKKSRSVQNIIKCFWCPQYHRYVSLHAVCGGIHIDAQITYLTYVSAEVKVSRNSPERRSGKRIVAGTAFRLEFQVR